MSFNLVDYNGKTALVVGAATGMGGATGQLLGKLGARVIAIDIADVSYPVSEAIKLDLRDRPAIDRAVAGLPEKIDAVFCCAGMADGVPGINGVILLVDYGHVNCSMTDGWDDPWLGALMTQS